MLNIATIILTVIGFLGLFIESLIGQRIANTIATTIGKYEDITYIINLDFFNWIILGLVLFFSYIRLLQMISEVRAFSHFSLVIQIIRITELNFVLYFIIIFMITCQIFYMILMTCHQDYNTFISTAGSLMILLLGKRWLMV